VYYLGSAFGGVAVEAEQVVEGVLGGGEFGELAAGAGAASLAGVEHGDFVDAVEVAEEFGYG